MLIELNFKSGRPAYRQIVDQVKYAMAQGALRKGEQLPSVRVLAERLRLNRNTVAKAYSELEHEGAVETRQGLGVFCAGGGSPLGREAKEAILAEVIDGAVVQAHHFQVGGEELLRLVKERIEEFHRRRRGE